MVIGTKATSRITCFVGTEIFSLLKKMNCTRVNGLKEKKNGNGLISVLGSNEKYKGEFFNDQKEGNGTYYYANGDIYSGEWDKDQKAGFGTMYFENNNYYRGNWFIDTQDGKGEYVWSNGCKYLGEWYNNLMKGYGELINKSQKIRISGKFMFQKKSRGFITGEMFNQSTGNLIYKGDLSCVFGENGFPIIKKRWKGL